MKLNKTIAGAALALVIAAGSVSSASAADFTVTPDKTANLVAAADTIVVTLANVPASTGVYVRLCAGTAATIAAARPTDCFGQGAWVSTDARALGMGATSALAPVKLAVQAAFKATKEIDCRKDGCGIHVRRDHFGSTDLTLDRFIPVTFAAPAATAKASLVANKVYVAVSNAKGKKVTFVVGKKKIVRTALSDKYVFSAGVMAGKSVKVSATLAGKELVAASF